MKRTGARTPLNRFKGHSADIAEQLRVIYDIDCTPDDVAQYGKRLAIPYGYPCLEFKARTLKGSARLGLAGHEFESVLIPKSMGDPMITDTHIGLANTVLASLADQYNLWLTEYDGPIDDPDAKPYRTIGGRSRAEMLSYFDWLVASGHNMRGLKREEYE